MKFVSSIVLGSGLLLSSYAFACPIGTFAVTGWNPGVATDAAPSYRGTASITAKDDVCQMEWKIGSQSFGGVGFYNAEYKQLNIAYANLKEGWFGEVSYQLQDSVFNGRWAVYGDNQGKVGKEVLVQQ